jgi:hypothetical protein
MIIGNKNTVAIECYNDTETTDPEYVFGRMCFWLNNSMYAQLAGARKKEKTRRGNQQDYWEINTTRSLVSLK